MHTLSQFALGSALAVAIATGAAIGGQAAAGTFVSAPQPRMTAPATGKIETAIFAGGCFWGVEGVFDHVKGVLSATSGYAGGKTGVVSYEKVLTGSTGHAESVRVVFDPAKVSYAELLRVYFSVVADPTTLNYQGPDHGTQYRTALFPQSAAQALVARAYIQQLTQSRTFARPIVTSVENGKTFYRAERYHQDFMAKNPTDPYIVINDRPKVDALRSMFPQLYRS